MITLPKLLLIVLLAVVVWYAVRWLNRPAQKAVRRHRAGPQQPQAAVEDLTACRQCGTYVAAGAGCGRPGCPQLR